MKPQTTLAFAAAFLVMLGLFAYMQYTHQPTTAELGRMQAHVIPELFNVTADHVTEVTLKREKEDFSFTHDAVNDQWQMNKPLDVLADASAIRNIVNDVKGLEHMTLSGAKDDSKYGVVEVKNKTDLVQYDLDEPKKTVAITYKSREGKGPAQTTTLLVGGTAAGDEGQYVKLPDQNLVFVVRKSSLSSLDKKVAEFREQKLITTNRWNADRVALAWPDRKLTAEKADGKWRMVEPVADRGDRTKIEELLGKITDLKADNRDTDFIDDNVSDLAKYGLDKPALVAEVRKEKSSSTGTDDKSKSKEKEKPQISQKLLIGNTVEGKDEKVYAMLDGQKYVVAVNASVLKDADKQPGDLRSHDLVELNKPDVDFVRIERAGTTIAIGKKDFDWELYQPKSMKAEGNAVTEFVDKIDAIEIQEFIDQGDPTEFGLDQPSVAVAFYEKGLKPEDKDKDSKDKGKKDEKKQEEKKEEKTDAALEPKGTPIQILFGKRDEEKKLIYAQRGDEPGIFAVSEEGLRELLDRDYLAYRTKSVLNLLSNDVAKLSVHRDGKTFSVERKKEKQGEADREVWHMTEPVDAPADSNSVERALFDFSRLIAKTLVVEGATDLKPFGLDEAKFRVTVTMKSEGDKKADQHVLLIGSEIQGDGGHYAKLADGDLVFSVEQRTVNSLNTELHDHSVLKFDSSKIEGLTLTWPDAKLELANKKPEDKPAKEWSVVGSDEFKLDSKKPQDLVNYLTNLTTDKFAQYQGEFTESHGLDKPALLLEVKLEGDDTPKTLRIGAATEDGKRYAAAAEKSGPVATLSEERLKDYLQGPNYFALAEEKKPQEKKPEPLPSESKKDDASSSK